jgi:hypothetical protein
MANLGVSVNGKPVVSKTTTGGSIPSTPASKPSLKKLYHTIRPISRFERNIRAEVSSTKKYTLRNKKICLKLSRMSKKI